MLSDVANVRDGLLNVIGGGVGVTTRDSFPSDLSSVVLAFRLILSREDLVERPQRDIGFVLRRQGENDVIHKIGNVYDGTDLLPLVDTQGVAEIPLTAPIVLAGFPIEAPGDYEIAVVVDEIELIALPITVTNSEQTTKT
jgi:hypothetical protein